MSGKKNTDIFSVPSYIVLNVPSPFADKIRTIRSFIDPSRANLAVEISLCGSNGRGTISPGQDPQKVFAEIDAIAGGFAAFSAAFGEVRRFPDTGIFYYTLRNNEFFTQLHQLFVQSRIEFEPTDFPYEPHCTLKLDPQPDYSLEDIIRHLTPPQESFIIDTLSVYSLDPRQLTPRLLHRVNLKTEK
ncbi:MAG: 2'-5' RNA ligase family protein [Victivallales bacterium]|nr:2'-5' RNA ligase family protein [Victivallales bacterium]